MPRDNIDVDIQVSDRDLKRAQRSIRRFGATSKREFDRSSVAAQKNQAALRGIGNAAALLGVAYTSLRVTRGFLSLSDEAKQFTNQVKQATRETGEFVKVNKDLRDISFATYAPLKTTVSLFREISRLRPELGSVLRQEKQFVTAINQAAVIGGSSADAIRNSLRQLSQGLAAGILRAEEWNSIIENTPEIANQIAKGMDTTVGKLRKMVIEGKVLSKDVFNAILNQSAEIQRNFDKLERTGETAQTNFRSGLIELVEGIDKLTSASESYIMVVDRMTASMRGIATELNKPISERSWWGRFIDTDNWRETFAGMSEVISPESTRQWEERLRELDRAKALSGLPGGAPTQAAAGGSGGGGANAPSSPSWYGNQRHLSQLETMGQTIMKEKQMEEEWLNSQYEIHSHHLQNIDRFNEARLAANEDYLMKKKQHDDDEEKRQRQKMQTYQTTSSAITGTFGNLAAAAEMFADKSKSGFELFKNLKRAEIIASTASAVMAAFASGTLYGGPVAMPLAIAQATSAGIFGATQLAQLNATNFTGRAMGGTIAGGRLYEVAERGPELLMAGGRSYLMSPQGGMVSPMKPTVNINVINQSGASVTATATEIGVDLLIQEASAIAVDNQV